MLIEHKDGTCETGNTPAELALLKSLLDVRDAAANLLEDHGDDCDCSACEDVVNYRGVLKIWIDMLVGEVSPRGRRARNLLARDHAYYV